MASKKNSAEVYGAQGKTNLLMFDPADLVIVEDVASALHDERAKLAVNESLVLNIMHHGVLQPIVVRRNPDSGKTEVVAGRQRVKACREANKRLKKQGLEPHRIPAIVKRGEPHALMGVMVSENELRENDTPMGRAKKMQRYIDLGRTEEETATVFGCSVPTVKNLLRLLDAPKEVRRAVESGQIAASDAYKLSKLEPAEAKKKLAEIEKVAPAAPKGERRPREAARKAREVLGDGPAVRGKKELLEKLAEIQRSETVKEMHRAGAEAALLWVMGDEAALGVLLS
jgi:ParB family transcriptional regulator, chromosome partitioning protein